MILKYRCMKCGICCYEVEENELGYRKRIPLYPEEVDELIDLAKKYEIEFKVIEDLVFPDIINKNILVLTFKICLDNPKACCPFYDQEEGCTIHEKKPLACKAYPLALKRIDSFNMELSIDPLCNFVSKNYNELKNISLNKIKEIFEIEYPNVERFYRKNKSLILKIRQLEFENKIKITREISLDDFNKALKEWDRIEIRVK